MKIKSRNIGILIYTAFLAAFFIFSIVKSLITHISFNMNAYITITLMVLICMYLFLSSIYGTYIEVKDDMLIRSEGFPAKKFFLEKITRIYCAQHVFLGPSMFFESEQNESLLESFVRRKEKKLLVLSQYSNEDKKALLDFLAEKYPEIQQDHNCQKIRNGEKVLTTLKDK